MHSLLKMRELNHAPDLLFSYVGLRKNDWYYFVGILGPQNIVRTWTTLQLFTFSIKILFFYLKQKCIAVVK